MLNHKAYEEIPSTKRGCKGQMETILEQALRTCTNVKARQTKAQNKGMEYLETIIQEEDMMNKHKVLLFTLEPGKIDSGIAGLCANKIMSKYQRPCCILTKTTTESKEHLMFDPSEDYYVNTSDILNIYQGSARGYEQGGINNFKDICEETGETILTAGHQNAFGLGIPEDNIDNFLEKTDVILKNMQSEPLYYVDYIYNGVEVNKQNILDIASLDNLWGKDIPESLIAIKNLKITNSMINIYEKKDLTLKINLLNNISIMLFNAPKTLCEKIKNCSGYISMNIIGKCKINEWGGNTTPQILIEDYEITDECNYMF